ARIMAETSRRPGDRRITLRDLIVVAVVAGGVWVAVRLGRLVLVVVLAIFLAYLLAPLVKVAQKPIVLRGRSRCVPRGVAILAVYLVLAGAACGLAALLWPRAAQQIDAAIAS